MKKKRLNKVLNIVVTLMAAIALMLGNVTSVAAYTDINGYPFEYAEMYMEIFSPYTSGIVQQSLGVAQDQNSYHFKLVDDNTLYNVDEIRFGNTKFVQVFPYEPDTYDYYLVGSCAFDDYYNYNDLSFFPTSARTLIVENDVLIPYHCQANFYPFESWNLEGFSFDIKLDLGDNGSFSSIGFLDTSDSDRKIRSECFFSAAIVPIPKGTDYTSVLSSILQTLNQINQNIITGNTLQQQTIDAINQNTTNTSNWFTTLISTMQGWYNTQTENLRTWFYMIEERMSAGFTALYHQMTKEQDEKLNGYEDTTQSDAANDFNTESDKLTELEGQLNDQSHGFVSDYTSTGFDTGVLSTISSSLIFVTTWFANFWNMGGIFTAGLNFCFSLSIVFFILRLRR